MNDKTIKQEKIQLLTSFRTSLDAIVQKASQEKFPIDEEEPQLEKFCSTLEGILQYGFKSENQSISLLEAVWTFIYDTLGQTIIDEGPDENSSSDILDIVEYISKSYSDIYVSSVKMWIQVCLVNQVLSSQWQLLMKNVEAINENYHEWAIVRNLDDSILISGFLNVFDTIEFNITSLPEETNLKKRSFNDIVGKSVLNFRSTINNTLQKTSQHIQKLQMSVNDKNVQYYKNKIQVLVEEKKKMQEEINALHLTLEVERRLRQQLEIELSLLHRSSTEEIEKIKQEYKISKELDEKEKSEN